jgi:oligopeptide transport system substrate-binding protein
MTAGTLQRTLSRRDLVKGGSAVTALIAMGAPNIAGIASAQDAEQVLRMSALTPINPTGPFDLALIGGGPGIQMANMMFEGLTVFDWNAHQVVAAAADTWELSADNLTYTFHLKQGMLWSDGSPLTAHDFEYAMKRNLDPALAAPLASFLYPIKGAEDYNTGKTTDTSTIAVTATDDLTLTMVMSDVTSYWPSILTLWTCFPINKKSIDAGGANWMQPETLITNGRYTMESWTPDQSMVLARNENFHGDKPGITKIEYTLFQNENEQALAVFQTGDLDTSPVSAANLDFVKSDPDLSKLLTIFPISGTWQLRLDMSNTASVISNVDVRKALYLAIDRDVLANNVLKGVPTPAYILTSPDIPSYDESARLEGTLDDAKTYLANAGYPDGANFPGFKLGYVSSQQDAQLACEAIVQMWKDNLGITAEAFAVPTDWRQRIKTEKFDMYYGGWTTDYPDPHEWHDVVFAGDAWQSHWTDQKYLDMIHAASIEPDNTKRYQMYADAEKYMIQDQMATIPLMTQRRPWVVQTWVQNLDVAPLDGPLIKINAVTIAAH